MNLAKREQSITSFKRHIRTHLKRLRKTGRPEILTVNGKPALVVQNADAFQQMLDAIKLEAGKAGLKKDVRMVKKLQADYKVSSSKK